MAADARNAVLLHAIESFEIQCPNPECPRTAGHEHFRRGSLIEIIVQNGMETVAAFVLGMREFSACGACRTVIPIPCLFRDERACEHFLRNVGDELIARVWNGWHGVICPSFIGPQLDLKAFQEKSLDISRFAGNILSGDLNQEESPFLCLETGYLGILSVSSADG